MRNPPLFLGTNDNFTARPLLPDDIRRVDFIGLGFSSLHAVSYLNDIVGVRRATIVDNCKEQLDWTWHCLLVAADHTSRREYYEDLFNISFGDQSEPLSFKGVDLTRMQKALGYKGPLTLVGEGVQVPQPDHPTISKVGPCSLSPAKGSDTCFGHRTGFLQQDCFSSSPVPMHSWDYRLEDITDTLRSLAKTDRPTVVWMSNVALWYWYGRNAQLQLALMEAKQNPNLYLWHSVAGKYRDVAKKAHGVTWNIADKTPHQHADGRINPRLLSGSTVYVYPEKQEGAVLGPTTLRLGVDDFLAKPYPADNVVLHMCSMRDQPWTDGELTTALDEYPNLDQVLQKAQSESRRQIVLEHNSETFEREGLHNSGVSPDLIHELAEGDGKDRFVDFCWSPGRRDLRRNFVEVFGE